ncbi:MAG TPA: ribonuclease P protein component [Clostridiales bacterium]|nr:ribonuclease P protein component [Clostridiales bacterium]
MKRLYSLKRNKEFRYVYKTGKAIASKCLVLVYRRSNHELPRIGFSVSKKIGNSVTRNRVKRRMRAAFSPLLPRVKPGSSIIFVAREPILNESFLGIVESIEGLLNKAGLLSPTDDMKAREQ